MKYSSPKSETRKASAKKLLWHYMQTLAEKSGVRLDGDCHSEIDQIIDDIEEMTEAMIYCAIENHVNNINQS